MFKLFASITLFIIFLFPITFFGFLNSASGAKVEEEEAAEVRPLGAVLDTTEDATWFENRNFALKMQKIPGWRLKKALTTKGGAPTLSLTYTKFSEDLKYEYKFTVNVVKVEKPENYVPPKNFIPMLDGLIEAQVGKLKYINYILMPQTIDVGNLEAREVIYEYKDGGERFTKVLVFFPTIEKRADLLNASVVFVCKSEYFVSLRHYVDDAIASIRLGE
jgi:hypothetical protein